MAKAKAKPNAVGPKPIADVLHPNDSQPAENSRSVIITKRPLMRDPMMAAPASDTPTEPNGTPAAPRAAPEPVTAAPLTVTHQLVITPPTHDEPTAPAVVGTPTAVQPISDVIAAPTAAAEPVGAPNPETSAAIESAAVKLDPINLEAAEAQAEDDDAKRKEELAALVTNQIYFLPVDGVELKRARYFTVLGVLLIIGLAVAWADIALDAGLVSVKGVPHTTFFQQAKIATVDPMSAIPATQSYSAPLSKHSLKLPATWTLDITKATSTQDLLTAGPAKTNATGGSTTVQFTSGPNLASTPVTAVVDSVRYQKITRTKGSATYLREVVYHTDQTYYNVAANIVNDNTLKVGDSLTNLAPTFYTTDVNKMSQLAAITNRPTGFASKTATEKYIQMNAYQQARTVLLSLSSPKQ